MGETPPGRGQWRENGRRAAECAAVGLLVTAFSIPVVTAGAAWIAAATIFASWTREEEPPLLATFTRTVRAQWRTGLVFELAAVVIAAVGYLDTRFAWAAGVPGARVEVVALLALTGVAAALLLLAVVVRAGTGAPPIECARQAAAIAVGAPWTVPALAAAVAVCVVLVLVVPAFVLLIAGPLGFAAAAVHARATVEPDPAG